LHNPTENDAGAATGVGVAIFITSSPASEDQPEPMPGHVAVVAGYEGTYRKQPVGPPTGARDEVWVVGIEVTMITIAVSAETGVTEAELAEAHAIVESVRTEPWETQAGFRMIFTLPPGWDSA
jgi:hypothetical protein